jgi:hypothetical protein
MGSLEKDITADVVLSLSDVEFPNWFDDNLITPIVLLKSTFAIISDIFTQDIKNAQLAFPNVKIR